MLHLFHLIIYLQTSAKYRYINLPCKRTVPQLSWRGKYPIQVNIIIVIRFFTDWLQKYIWIVQSHKQGDDRSLFITVYYYFCGSSVTNLIQVSVFVFLILNYQVRHLFHKICWSIFKIPCIKVAYILSNIFHTVNLFKISFSPFK